MLRLVTMGDDALQLLPNASYREDLIKKSQPLTANR